MLYFGIVVNLAKMEEALGEDVLDAVLEHTQTAYSASPYDPELAILGYAIDSQSCLFNPIDLNDIVDRSKSTYGGKQSLEVKRALDELFRKYSELCTFVVGSMEPRFLIAELTDD